MADKSVFISYRRESGSEVARVLQEFLEGQGFVVFLDVDSLGAGHFDEQLLDQISTHRNFLLVCSPGCLDRCIDHGDWVRREIAHALKTKRHVVPVTLPQFVWPDMATLPGEIAELQRHNAFEYSHSHWRSTKLRLLAMLDPDPFGSRRVSRRASKDDGTRRRSAAVFGVMAVVLTLSGVLASRHLLSVDEDPANPDGPILARESGKAEALSDNARDEGVRVEAPLPQSKLKSLVGHEVDAMRVAPIGLDPSWQVEIIQRDADPLVVTDPDGRSRMADTGLPWKVRDKGTGIVMLLCPPGEFVMGSPASEVGRSEDETQHRRTIRNAFYLSETEVTQEQWQKAMGANPSHFQGERNPVESVSWSFCRQFLSASGMRFPTEAEWEYACRAGTSGAYAGDLVAMGWFEGTSGRCTHPVATKWPNPWGFFDMHGNVWEWVEDVYSPYPLTVGSDQQAVSAGRSSARVLRGGSFKEDGRYQRSSYRDKYGTVFRSWNYGLRAARDP